MKLEINNRRKFDNSQKMWRLNNTLLNNQRVKKEIKREIKDILKQTEMER